MIAAIEQAIIDRLKLAETNGVLGYRLKKIATYGGELTDGKLNEVVRGLPAFLVIFNEQTKLGTYQNGAIVEWRALFTVFCAAKSLRNEKAARHGTEIGEVGSYQMFKDALALIGCQKLGLEIGALIPQRVLPILNDRSDRDLASIYAVQFATVYREDNGQKADSLDDFETFHANWDVPVHGNVSTDLPADSTADATDQVTLEQDP